MAKQIKKLVNREKTEEIVNSNYNKDWETRIANWAQYAPRGLIILGIIGLLYTNLIGKSQLEKEKNSISNVDGVVRYYDIQKRFNTLDKNVFYQNVINKYYSKLEAEADSLRHVKVFHEAKKSYDLITEERDKIRGLDMISLMLLTIGGGLEIQDMIIKRKRSFVA